MKIKILFKIILLVTYITCAQEEKWLVIKSPLLPAVTTSGNSISKIAIHKKDKSKIENDLLMKGGFLIQQKNTKPNTIPANFIVCMQLDKLGNIWFGTFSGGVAKYDGTNWEVYNTSNSSLPSNVIYSIAIDKYNNKWIGTVDGLAKFDGKRWMIYTKDNSKLPSNMVYSLAIDKHDNKWIGTTKGLAMLSGSKWTSYHTLNSKLPHNHVTALAIDRDDNKWIGTFEGLAKLSRNNWQIFKRNNSPLPYDDIYSLNANNSGKILIGTWGGGLAMLDKSRWAIYKTDNSALPDNYVSSCLIDQAKNFWIATLGGLAKYDGTKWTLFKTSNSKLPDDMVYSLIQDQKGNIWIGTENGLAVFNETGIPNHVSNEEEFSAKIKNEKVVSNNQIIPSNYSLENIYYDSVNSKIKIHFSIPKRSNILLKIEDTLGRINKVLKNAILEAGNYEVELNAEKFPSGVYFCHLSAGELKFTRKIQLVN